MRPLVVKWFVRVEAQTGESVRAQIEGGQVCGVELGGVGRKSSSAAGCELVRVGARNVR